MSAAVCDYRPEEPLQQKMKKTDETIIKLVSNPDILKEIKEKELIKIGFALETEDLIENAQSKLQGKNLDMIVANRKTAGEDPFGEGRKEFVFISREGTEQRAVNTTKEECAVFVLDEVEKIAKERGIFEK